MNDPIRSLIAAEELPDSYSDIVGRFWEPLADLVTGRRSPGGPLLVGINGAQGSGKSTMCQFLSALLGERGLNAVVLSLDDFYLTRAERLELADTVHPLFATRGVPGTHDTPLMRSVLDGLSAGRSVEAPRFDKATDDRAPMARKIEAPVDVILFEGWCVGASPQLADDLAAPINALERDEDPDAVWRATVNRHLESDYAGIFRRLDMLVMLAVPDFSAVAANRRLQEQKLARRNPDGQGVMDEAALQRFIMHYERLTRHILAEMPGRADATIPIGLEQNPVSLPEKTGN